MKNLKRFVLKNEEITTVSMIKRKYLFITALLLSQTLKSASAQNDGRYYFQYPGDFFISSSKEVEFGTSVHRK